MLCTSQKCTGVCITYLIISAKSNLPLLSLSYRPSWNEQKITNDWLVLCTRPLVSTSTENRVVSFKISTFHNILNQYQACLYLYECSSHGDSKYSHQIPEFLNFGQFCDIFNLSSAHACRVERVLESVSITTIQCYFLG